MTTFCQKAVAASAALGVALLVSMKLDFRQGWAKLSSNRAYLLREKSITAPLTTKELELVRQLAKAGSYYAVVLGAETALAPRWQDIGTQTTPTDAKFWVETAAAWPELRVELLYLLLKGSCTPQIYREVAPLVAAWEPDRFTAGSTKFEFFQAQSAYLFYCNQLGYEAGAPYPSAPGPETAAFEAHFRKELPERIKASPTNQGPFFQLTLAE